MQGKAYNDRLMKARHDRFMELARERDRKKTFLEKIGLTKSFLHRKKKGKFSLRGFVKYMMKIWFNKE